MPERFGWCGADWEARPTTTTREKTDIVDLLTRRRVSRRLSRFTGRDNAVCPHPSLTHTRPDA